MARRFLVAAAGHRLCLAFELALVTGLRRGELLGLRWADIDFASGRLRVTQQLVVEGGRARLKSVHPHDRRVITLAPRVVQMLADHRRQQEGERALAADGWRHCDLVFCTPCGGWVTPERFGRAMEDLIERARVPRITARELRHTTRRLADVSHDNQGVQLDAIRLP